MKMKIAIMLIALTTIFTSCQVIKVKYDKASYSKSTLFNKTEFQGLKLKVNKDTKELEIKGYTNQTQGEILQDVIESAIRAGIKANTPLPTK